MAARILKLSERQESVATHKHYVYQMYFNNVDVKEKSCTCSLQSQQAIFREQLKKKDIRNFADKSEYLLYCNYGFCIYCLTTRTFKRASDASASEGFMVTETSAVLLLQGSSDKVYFSQDEISEIFDAKVVSLCMMNNFVQKVMSTLDVTLETVVCNNNVEERCMSMVNLKSVI